MSDKFMSQSRAILITGANGQLGTELKRCCWPEGCDIVAVNREQLDLTNTLAISAVMASRQWAAVINCAAYTAVDQAETDVVTAWTVNALAPAAFGEACAKFDIPLVQVSTDYVFAGDKTGAWEVGDPIAPLGVYGASKLGGELAVRSSGARFAIVRTAWVVSAHGKNFIKTVLRIAKSHESLKVVDDQRGSPTSAADLAHALMTITLRLVENAAAPTGIFHFSNVGATSWAGFATEIFRQSAARGGPVALVIPVVTDDYPTLAKRPANSLLSHIAIHETYGIEPRSWQTALSDILDELIGIST